MPIRRRYVRPNLRPATVRSYDGLFKLDTRSVKRVSVILGHVSRNESQLLVSRVTGQVDPSTQHVDEGLARWHGLALARATEPLHYLFRRDSELLQEFGAVARFFCQDSCQQMQGFYLAVRKLVLKSFRGTEYTLELGR